MITLEEQIKYMRGEISYWKTVFSVEKVNLCQAILATLESCRDERAGWARINEQRAPR